MTRRRRRQIVLIVILVLLLLVMTVMFINYRATRSFGFDIAGTGEDLIVPPDYLYSFSGTEELRLDRPIGVLVTSDDVVWVTDARRSRIMRFTLEGDFIDSFGLGILVVPLYMTQHPITGDVYVSDRRTKAVEIFSSDGEHVGTFDPDLPEDQLPTFETERQWAPVGLDFAPDGRLYVLDILASHRMLIFDADGDFVRSVGTGGMVTDSSAAPGFFQFPNGIKAHEDEVLITDSNNRRIQIFDLEGEFLRIIVTEGLPRGFDILAPRSTEATDLPVQFAVADPLSHDGTIWDSDGSRLMNFGESGVLEGQFSYPNDISVGPRNLMFVADTGNSRVQVWGWPADLAPIPLPAIPQQWGWCLTPLLLLPLLILGRKKKFFATADFVEGIVVAGVVTTMPARRRAWLVTPEDYERVKGIVADDIDLAELLHASEHSESDANVLAERLEIPYEEAKVLAIAKRAFVFCTEDVELRRLARLLEIDAVDRTEFLDRFVKTRRERPSEED